MVIREFPPLSTADDQGLLALGGDLEVESLLLAYKNGIFPWPLNEELLAWFSPPKRCLLFFNELHISRSLFKEKKRTSLQFAKDKDFSAVMHSCAYPGTRKKEKGTWITNEMISAYEGLFKHGYCHSYEAYNGSTLVGGIYGVQIGKFFAGESMFFREQNASKLAFLYMCEDLEAQGLSWFDCQVSTPLSRSFGAREVEREEFLVLLKEALD